MSKTAAIFIVLIGCLVLDIIYSIPGGHKKISITQKEYDTICIEGVTYVTINRGLNSAMMSVMLQANSQILPCAN